MGALWQPGGAWRYGRALEGDLLGPLALSPHLAAWDLPLRDHHVVSVLFGLRVRDVDCDFRLLRRAIFERIDLERTSGVICLELVKKIQDAGFRIVEVPVHHYHRAYGKSQFFNVRRTFKTAVDVFRLWFALVVYRRHRAAGSTLVTPNP